MSETTAQRNARYQREFRARHGEVVARQRVVKRIASGTIPRGPTLAKYGLSPDEVNSIRKENNLPEIDLSKFPTTCRKPETCVQVPVEKPKAPEPPTATSSKTPGKSTRSVGTQTEKSTATQTETPVATPAKSRGGMSVTEVAKALTDLPAGQPMYTKSGEVARTKEGLVKKIEKASLKQYANKLDLLSRNIGGADIVARLKQNPEEVVRDIKKRWPNPTTNKTFTGAIVSAAKYVPEFREKLGDAYDVYAKEMIGSIRASEKEAIERTEKVDVVPITKIRAKAKEVSKKFGDTSLKAIATTLQTTLTGLRDNLSGVKVVTSEREAKKKKIDNYYVPRTKKLVINKFKTSKEHDPYNFKLDDGIAKKIAASLKENPRDYLIAEKGVGKMVSDSLKAVGLEAGVNTIRHSQISSLLKNNPSEKNVRRIASMFKHSPTMTLRYFRGENPNDA